MRADIADVRLAEFVFAPHYAEPVMRVVLRETPLREAGDASSKIVVTLSCGDGFELLDVTRGIGWGIAPGPGLVGYVDTSALGAALD